MEREEDIQLETFRVAEKVRHYPPSRRFEEGGQGYRNQVSANPYPQEGGGGVFPGGLARKSPNGCECFQLPILRVSRRTLRHSLSL